MKLRFVREALAELQNAADWFDGQRENLGLEFLKKSTAPSRTFERVPSDSRDSKLQGSRIFVASFSSDFRMS
jgi:hypothetical protein